jgi:hypothetical protein
MAPAACSSFASSVLRRVVAKLAAATPEVEAACVVSWCKRAAQDELCQFDKLLEDGWESVFECELYKSFHSSRGWYKKGPDTPRRQTEYAAAAMLQLAASTNGRLALVSCGSCETLVDFMLQNKVSSVHGCMFLLADVEERLVLCNRQFVSDNDCSCDDVSCYFHRWYVCAALALEGCASGALRLNRAGWDRKWHAVEERGKTFEDEVILKLKHRALMVPPIVVHYDSSIKFARMQGYLPMSFRGYTPPRCICRPICLPGKYTAAANAADREDGSLCPLEEPAFLEFLDTTPGDDQAADEDEDDEDDADEDDADEDDADEDDADEDDEMASNVLSSRLE